MRVYGGDPQFSSARVLMNGQDISSVCVMADDQMGLAEIVVRAETGSNRLLVDDKGKPVTVTLKGKVEICV